ncbi:MAG: hypothetical protein RMK57_05335 [Bryobacterales bacterium]|nr:hypothetical protein [Bryobacteraceae bacterium]MDW8353937.1 hypothetical protein [Bryobacterales bacterium]
MRQGLVVLLVAAAGLAETKQEHGRRVVHEALEALGGRRFLAMQDRVETGRAYSFYREELSGLSIAKIYTKYVPRPQTAPADFLGVRERQAFGKDEYSSVLFTGDAGWEITFRGARPLPEEALERYRASTLHNIFYILRQRLDEPGLLFESRGSEVWMNQPVEIVDVVDSENRVVSVYFHRSTKLPLRQVFYRRDPKTRRRIEEDMEFGKYRDVGGIQWPFTMVRRRDGEKVYEIFSESVAINQNLSDSLFQLPPNIKILKRPL